MALAVDSISFDAVRVALNLVANMQRLEMTVRFFIQRLEQSGISEQRRQTVSEIDYQALREKAEKATKGSYIVGHTSVNQHGNLTGVFVCQKWKGEPGGVIAECHVNCLVETDVQAYANAEFIAAFNPNVALALLDELEHYKSREERVTKLVMDNSTSWNALYKKLKDVEKRIAELEAREILLPERSSMLHRTDFHDDYQTVMAYKVSEVIDAIRATGICIKGDAGEQNDEKP